MIIHKMFDRIFLKFILIGIVNTIVGSAVMFVLYNAVHLSYWFSSACNYVFTSVLSFCLNKYFTFSIRHWSAYMIAAFVLTIAVSYFIAYGISKPAVNYLLRNSPQTIRENIALFVGMCLFTIINYIGQRLIVFKKESV
jgi:putative flippase GtrA